MSREIRKIPCQRCSGTGSHSIETVAAHCEACMGLGWIEKSRGNEEVCPKCNGDGKASAVVQVACNDCKGKGYHVRIVEVTAARGACDACNGNAKAGEWRPGGTGQEPSKIACPECRGSGFAEKKHEVDVTPRQVVRASRGK